MKDNLKAPLFENKACLLRLVEDLSQDYDYVSLLATQVSGQFHQVDFHTLSVEDTSIGEKGYVVRVYNGEYYSEYAFDRLEPVDYEQVIASINQTVKADVQFLKARGHKNLHYPVIEEEAIEATFNDALDQTEKVPAKDILYRLKKLVGKAKDYHSDLSNFKVMYEVIEVKKAFYSSKKALEQAYSPRMLGMLALVSRDNKVQMESQSFSGMSANHLIDQAEINSEDLIDSALALLDAEDIEAGEYEIICDPEVSGLIAHEAFGHGVELDMFVKDRAKGKDYLDQMVASEMLNMTDGASSVKQVASYSFDDEGVLGQSTRIIESGRLKSPLSDVLSAMAYQSPPTGNGRRASFERKAYSRMTNTFFEAGQDRLEDMIKDTQKGYLLVGFNSGMEDPKNWGIQCVVKKGLEIINGKMTGKVVAPILMTGYVPDLLGNITAISKGPVVFNGNASCGKAYKEWLKVSIGGTYIKTKARLG